MILPEIIYHSLGYIPQSYLILDVDDAFYDDNRVNCHRLCHHYPRHLNKLIIPLLPFNIVIAIVIVINININININKY